MSLEERSNTDKWRDSLANQLNSQNASQSLERLALELDEQLGDKLYVANQLRLQQQHTQQRQLAYRGQTNKQFFALGAQLDSDAALEWFTGAHWSASSEPSYSSPPPTQVCRLCKRTRGTNQSTMKEIRENNDNEPIMNNSNENGVDVELAEQNKREKAGLFCTSDFQQPNTRWIRPLVLVLQSICVLITMILIAILLRVRKSRVSVQLVFPLQVSPFKLSRARHSNICSSSVWQVFF